MRKDIKKSSYYVWFLGAQEAKGLRGPEYIVPVIRSLVEREREVEPFKVTLQASYKGLKIVQNVQSSPAVPDLPEKLPPGKPSGKTEVVKHFIPHHAVTCVYREEDIVACILLLYNPVTECPVHVHAYRCDSVETATVLAGQLQTLIDRPENQKKLAEIETRLGRRRAAEPRSPSARESESSGGSSGAERMATLYDSLAAELREKLATGQQPPILLPPRDYDTVHRQKGDLSNIDTRRCLSTNVVGVNVVVKERPTANKRSPSGLRAKVGSSGGSSGIGSDRAPSPEQDRFLEEHSSSDEEWNIEPTKDSIFIAGSQKSWCSGEVSLPRARKGHNGSAESKQSPSPVSSSVAGGLRRRISPETPGRVKQEDEVPIPSQRWKRSAEERQRTPSPAQRSTSSLGNSLSPRERFNDAKEKFLLLERDEQERIMKMKIERRRQENVRPQMVGGRSRVKEDEQEEPVRPIYFPHEENELRYKEEYRFNRSPQPRNHGAFRKDLPMDREYLVHMDPRVRMSPPARQSESYQNKSHHGYGLPPRRDDHRLGRYENSGRNPTLHSYPEDVMEELGASSQGRSRDYIDRDMSSIPLERYRSPPRMEVPPNTVPRHLYSPTEIDEFRDLKNITRSDSQNFSRHLFDHPEKKRRSVYEAIEDERKRNSNELAKEFKRRSYQDQHGSFEDPRGQGYQDLDQDCYPGLSRENSKTQLAEELSARFRHSFVEPVDHTHDHLQRTSSSVTAARVGIAAIHPY